MLALLADDGEYRSQFETGTSSGGLSAYRGGSRWLWEQRIFDGAYDDAPPQHRPKYGALNHRSRDIGGAPRFGSAHLRLADHMLDRTTFCFPDSVLEPDSFGTASRFDLIPLAEAFAAVVRTEAEEQRDGGGLDDYVEAQVHGPIVLERDVEAVVLDPCFRATAIEEQAAALPVPVQWHAGRVLPIAELRRHPQFRGPDVVAVGEQLGVDGYLDARIIGEAAGRFAPDSVKRVWHLVARFGTPRAEHGLA